MRKFFALFVLLILSVFPLFANKYSFAAIPFTFQKIVYEDNTPDTRCSDCSAGFMISSYKNESSDYAFGFETSLESFNFEDFHSYYDLKLSGNIRKRVLNTENSRMNCYLVLGAGSDIVIRDDRAFGCYLLVKTAFEARYSMNDNFDFVFGFCTATTFQKGSKVLHLNNYIGASCPVRGK